jgi:Tfp pilus assembly protein FimT
VLIVLAVLFTLQTTAVTPFSSTTTDKHLENQERETVSNAIEIAHSNGNLKQTLLNWETTNTTNHDEDGFAGREDANETRYYTSMDADTAFLNQLSKSIDTTQTAYNVNLVYYNTSTDPVSETLLRSGSPSDNVISVRKPIVLHDSDTLTTNESLELQEIDSSRFYADDLNESTPTYNYVEVEVVVWRR